MPRIPRAEGQTSTQIASMPNLVGEGWTAPARATQQLGQGVQQLGSAFNQLAEQQDADHLHEMNLELLNTETKFKMEEMQNRATYEGDGKSYGADRLNAWNMRAAEVVQKYSSGSPKMRRAAAMWAARTGQEVGVSAATFGRSRYEDWLYAETEKGMVGQLQQMTLPQNIERYKADPAAFDADLDGAIKMADAMVNGYTANPDKKRQLSNTAAGLIKDLLGNNDISTEAKLESLRKRMETLTQPVAPVGPQSSIGGVNIEPSGDMAIVRTGSGARLRVSQPHAERFAGLVADLEARGIKIDPDQTGGYANRNIRGTNTRSRHADGEAIDLNWTDNARGAPGQFRKQLGEKTINELAAKWGLKWGGNWSNPDDMHFEVDRGATPQARFTASAASRETGIAAELSAYSPRRKGSAMEGGYASSRPGPDGKREVRTLDDVVAGRSEYVTVAGDPKFYGKTYTIPKIDYVDASGNRQALTNVKAVVHDTGPAFRGKPEGRFDIAIARDVDEKTMAANHAAWKEGGVRFVPDGEKPEAPKPPTPLRMAKAANDTATDASPDGARETNTIPGTQVVQAGAAQPPTGRPSPLQAELFKDLLPMVKTIEQKFVGEVASKIKNVDELARTGDRLNEKDRAVLERQIAKTGNKELAALYQAATFKGELNARFRQMPPAALATYVAQREAQVAAAGTTEEGLAEVKSLRELHSSMVKALEKDPLGWGIKVGILAPSEPITRETFTPDNLAKRAADVAVLRQRFGDEYVQYFSPEEQEWLKSEMSKGGKAVIDITRAMADGFGGTAAPFKEFEKHAVEAAHIGWLSVNNGDTQAVRDLAQGLAWQKEDPDTLKAFRPKAEEIYPRIISDTGRSFMMLPDRQRVATDIASTIYAVRAHRKGLDPKGGLNTELWREAFAEAIGETKDERTGVKYGGLAESPGKWFGSNAMHVLLPPNVKQDALPDLIAALRPAYQISAQGSGKEQFREGQWQPVPSGDQAPQVLPEVGRAADLLRTAPPTGGANMLTGAATGETTEAPDAGRALELAAAMGQGGRETVSSLSPPINRRGEPMRWASVMNGYFVSVGPGVYMISTTDPQAGTPEWVGSATEPGGRFIIDLKRHERYLREKVPSAFKPGT